MIKLTQKEMFENITNLIESSVHIINVTDISDNLNTGGLFTGFNGLRIRDTKDNVYELIFKQTE